MSNFSHVKQSNTRALPSVEGGTTYDFWSAPVEVSSNGFTTLPNRSILGPSDLYLPHSQFSSQNIVLVSLHVPFFSSPLNRESEDLKLDWAYSMLTDHCN